MIEQRRTEAVKYEAAYKLDTYKMGMSRMTDAVHDLREVPSRGSYLDVGCGRGEMLDHAQNLGFEHVQGTEIVHELIDYPRVLRGEVHALPFEDRWFDVVSMFDVIEHLIPGDDYFACMELVRVARKHILLTASNNPSSLPDGTNLHINIRSYEEWNDLFRVWFPGDVTWIKGQRNLISEGWRIDF